MLAVFNFTAGPNNVKQVVATGIKVTKLSNIGDGRNFSAMRLYANGYIIAIEPLDAAGNVSFTGVHIGVASGTTVAMAVGGDIAPTGSSETFRLSIENPQDITMSDGSVDTNTFPVRAGSCTIDAPAPAVSRPALPYTVGSSGDMNDVDILVNYPTLKTKTIRNRAGTVYTFTVKKVDPKNKKKLLPLEVKEWPCVAPATTK